VPEKANKCIIINARRGHPPNDRHAIGRDAQQRLRI